MSELRVFEQARMKLENKRRELASVLASGDSSFGELAAAFITIQSAIEAVDKAIADETRMLGGATAPNFGAKR